MKVAYEMVGSGGILSDTAGLQSGSGGTLLDGRENVEP